MAWPASNENGCPATPITRLWNFSETWMRPGCPVLSMRLARFTVLPQMSNIGLLPCSTPAMMGPGAEVRQRACAGSLPSKTQHAGEFRREGLEETYVAEVAVHRGQQQ